MRSLKIDDNVQLCRVPNECEHDSLYVTKLKQSTKDMLKVAKEILAGRRQRCSGVSLHIK